jgi:predicted metalloprotease with PDZ domain
MSSRSSSHERRATPTTCAWVLAFVSLSCATMTTPSPRPGSTDTRTLLDDERVVWDYDVSVDPALDLDVRATFLGPLDGSRGLRVDEAATAFVERLELESASGWQSVRLDDARLRDACAARCTVRYRFRLRDAAKALADVDTAIATAGAIFSPPSTWLLRPSGRSHGRYRFRVTTPEGVRFATGIREASGLPGTHQAPTSSFEEAAFAAFGALRTGRLAPPAIDYALAPELPLSDDVASRWLRSEVTAIGSYFGHPPDGHAMVFVGTSTSADTGGKTLAGGGASLFVRIGKRVTAANLTDDWVVAHELVHVAFPDLDRRYTWFSEGLATYVEPIARARAGLIAPEKVWADMIDGLPQGFPRPGDTGLDGTSDWGRVYWGGALYFFLADVRIRERTHGAQGLEHALRAVIAKGGNVESMWTLDRVIDLADGATGTTVLRELHDELGRGGAKPDVDALFRRLGVRSEHGVASFDDAAPLASVRDAILPRARAK